jgi:peptidyl-prolyl cis-trans isomerase A (cyclophilin A)
MLVRIGLAVLSLAVAAAAQTSATPTRSHGTHTPPKTIAGPKNPSAILHTTEGDMKCELFADKTPNTVKNFIGLANGTKDWKDPATGKMVHGKPLYDGVIFHRTIPGFMIQTGDPSGTGAGDVGFEFANELTPDLLYDMPGRLAMANRGIDTNSSQFFITEVPRPSLNPCLDDAGCQRPWGHVDKNSGYTIFGQCDEGSVELVKKIARMPCQAGMPCDDRNSRPQNPVKITHIEILNTPAASKGPTKAPSSRPKPRPSSSPGAP